MLVAVIIKASLVFVGIVTAIMSTVSLAKRNTTPTFCTIWIVISIALILTGIFIEPYNWANIIGISTLIFIGILFLSAIVFLWYLTKKIDELQHNFNETAIQLSLLTAKNKELQKQIESLYEEAKQQEDADDEILAIKNKDILFVNNTLSSGGVETALIEQLRQYSINNNVYLYVMTGMGELINKVPANVQILNDNFDPESVLTNKGQKKLFKKVMLSEKNSFTGIRLAGYTTRGLANMIRNGKIHFEKLAWRPIAETAPPIPKTFDLAIAFIEGASTYYVADKVAAKHKVAWVHTNYELAGYTKQLDKNSYDEFDEIFTVSNQVKKSFIKIHPECLNKVKLKNLFLPKNKIIQLSNESINIKCWQNISQDTTKILSVGRLIKLKSYETLINAAVKLKNNSHKFVWIVLGEGDQHQVLQKLIDSFGLNDNFILMGHVSNPFPFYNQCDIFVHSTKYEGKSIAVQEAKILGCPIVLSETAGNIGQIQNKVNGIYCQPNSDDIASKIEFLISNKEIASEYGKQAQVSMM